MASMMLDKSMKKHKKGLWSPDEDQKLRNYVLKHGHGLALAQSSMPTQMFQSVRWSQIAQRLPGRTDNAIKNYWHSCLKKRRAERSARKCSFPKVLFAEWLSFDHFKNDHNLDNHSSSLEDNLVDGLLVDEGMFCVNRRGNGTRYLSMIRLSSWRMRSWKVASLIIFQENSS
ncbi:UNVERIFIED_CONTAM: Transcription factor [Sesamum calycinum]|uniref:Transcription factor n=1 Tax=Sesamum calycinum TaxID=2727403 RepID=A0AAW2RS88_9LAMI